MTRSAPEAEHSGIELAGWRVEVHRADLYGRVLHAVFPAEPDVVVLLAELAVYPVGVPGDHRVDLPAGDRIDVVVDERWRDDLPVEAVGW
jgi:hypothetical protein